MENGAFAFLNIFKHMIFQRRQKALVTMCKILSRVWHESFLLLKVRILKVLSFANSLGPDQT